MVDKELTIEQVIREAVHLGAYSITNQSEYKPYSLEELIELIKQRESKLVLGAKDEVLDELLDWYENPPMNVKPFNWYGAVKALKISKDFKKPFVIFSPSLAKERDSTHEDN